MPLIGSVADDLTGATTTGVLLARSKARTAVFFNVEAAMKAEGVDELDAIIISSNSRPLPANEAYDKVKDVAVIGLPDKRLGEITGAIISVKDGMECTEEEIEEYCMKLPRYKRPKKIIFADVPRNATGKIEKPALRKKYGAEYLVAQQNRA